MRIRTNFGTRKFFVSKLIRAILICSVATTSLQQAFGADRNQLALDMIQQMHLGNNLKALGFAAATNTETYRGVVLKKGADTARQMLIAQIEIVAPRYQARWDQNLAAAYLDYFTPDELESVFNAKSDSPYFNKFFSMQSQVGQSMQSRSTKLLTDMTAEIIAALFRQANPI
jgi:hypothetical protein